VVATFLAERFSPREEPHALALHSNGLTYVLLLLARAGAEHVPSLAPYPAWTDRRHKTGRADWRLNACSVQNISLLLCVAPRDRTALATYASTCTSSAYSCGLPTRGWVPSRDCPYGAHLLGTGGYERAREGGALFCCCDARQGPRRSWWQSDEGSAVTWD